MNCINLSARLTAAMLLLAVCLSACGGEPAQTVTDTTPESTAAAPAGQTEPGSKTAPTRHTEPAAPDETGKPTGQTEPAEPSAAPEYTADAAGKIASVSVGTPEEWNRFARDFNAGRNRFAESIDVFIETQLSFAGTAFVALTGTFSGRIYGPAQNRENVFEGFENESGEKCSDMTFAMVGGSDGWYGGRGSEADAGFCDIDAVEGGISLFGGDNGDLTIENLGFSDISYSADDSRYEEWGKSGMLCGKADSLTLDAVTFTRCMFRQNYTIVDGSFWYPLIPTNLLAKHVETLRLHRVLAANCDAVSLGKSGLFFDYVMGDASFSEIYLLGCSVTAIADDWGYLALLGYSVEGKADYEDITMFDCRTYGYTPSALGRAGSVGKLRNVTVESCKLTTPQGVITHSGSSSLLFFTNGEWYDYPGEVWYDLEEKTLEGVTPENVVFENCMATLYKKDFDWYRDRGITVENCLNVTTGPAKREYQMWMYGEVYD